MACTICRAPILVHEHYLEMRSVTQVDHLDPIVAKVCPTAHQPYFAKVMQLDRRFEGVVMGNLVHAGRGLFMSRTFEIMGGMANPLTQEEMEDGVTTNNVFPIH